MDYNKDELDPTKLSKLKMKIFAFERENHKTKKYKDNEMVMKIRKLIEQEVENDY